VSRLSFAPRIDEIKLKSDTTYTSFTFMRHFADPSSLVGYMDFTTVPGSSFDAVRLRETLDGAGFELGQLKVDGKIVRSSPMEPRGKR
jgi:hypothetical protein